MSDKEYIVQRAHHQLRLEKHRTLPALYLACVLIPLLVLMLPIVWVRLYLEIHSPYFLFTSVVIVPILCYLVSELLYKYLYRKLLSKKIIEQKPKGT